MARKSFKNRIKSGIKFVTEDVWETPIHEFGRLRAFLAHQVKILYLVGKGFVEDRLTLRASALTYSTLLSIVPLLAFMFALLKGLGALEKIKPLLYGALPEAHHNLVDGALEFVANVNMGSLGPIGLMVLLFSVISIMGNIEKAMNTIWGIKTQRPLIRKLSDYLSLLIVFPLFLLLTTTVT